MKYYAIASLLRVDRSDDCIWLVDERGPAQSVHMTPDQAAEVGEALIEAGGLGGSREPSSNILSIPIASRLAEDIYLNEYGRCATCRKQMSKGELTSSGKCYTCSSPANEMAMAAGLDMEAIVKDVVEAGILDMFRKKKSEEQLIAEFTALVDTAAKKTEDQGYKDVQEGLEAPVKELRKRFPKNPTARTTFHAPCRQWSRMSNAQSRQKP